MGSNRKWISICVDDIGGYLPAKSNTMLHLSPPLPPGKYHVGSFDWKVKVKNITEEITDGRNGHNCSEYQDYGGKKNNHPSKAACGTLQAV